MKKNETDKLEGYNYIDFNLSKEPENFQPTIAKKDLCERIEKAIHDERQAIIDYKGLIIQHFNTLSEKEKKEIIEISNDETDHRAKFELILKKYHC